MTDPHRRILHGKKSSIISLNEKDTQWVSRKKLTSQHLIPSMRNRRHPELGFSPMDFHSKWPLPTAFFFSKSHSSPLFVGLAYDFCYSLLVQNCNSLPFLSKPIFAGKVTFIFRVDIIWWPMWGCKEDPPLASLGLCPQGPLSCQLPCGPWNLTVSLSSESALLLCFWSSPDSIRVYFKLRPFLIKRLCLQVLGQHFSLTLEIRLFSWNCARLWPDSFWNRAVSTEIEMPNNWTQKRNNNIVSLVTVGSLKNWKL